MFKITLCGLQKNCSNFRNAFSQELYDAYLCLCPFIFSVS